MIKSPEQDFGQKLPELPGHAIGIFDSAVDGALVTDALNKAGFPMATILVFEGEDGIELMTRMMDGYQWGESTENFMKQCLSELQRGNRVVSVEVRNQSEAAAVAAIATPFGGRSVYHFGTVVDTRLTR